ncbi:membrane protein insertion efficiency factor YidD [candidate division NPL-UPA2 bacterium]|nr:membrane protein insertion efficiency factor YidD [candidate division NPL-UPA2 bacterium]
MSKIIIFLIIFYQKCLSPLKPSTCRFHPSCSDYARQAIGRKGLRRGGWQAVKRLLRCHPLNPGGYDPMK